MKHIFYILLCLSCIWQTGRAQRIGQWEPHQSYYNTTAVAEGNNYVFAIAKGAQTKYQEKISDMSGALFCYGKEDNSIKFYSRDNGLYDNGISHIGFNSDVNTLLIVYSNGNMDLLQDDGFHNLPHLLNSSNIRDKSINSIFFHKEFAYLSAEFGIMVVNLKEREITDTYKLDKPVYSVCIKGNELFAVTPEGIIKGSMDSNLLDRENWQPYPFEISDSDNKDIVQKISLFQGVLCCLIKDKGVYYQQADGAIKPLIKENLIQNIKLQNGKLLSFTTNTAFIHTSLTQFIKIPTGTINDISSLKNENTYWIAAGRESIKGIKVKPSSNEFEIIASDTITSSNCPKRNLAAFLTIHNQKLLIAGGDRSGDRSNNIATLMIYDKGSWYNLDENEVITQSKSQFMDLTSIAVNPKDDTHYFVSTWGEGVFEFKDNKFVHLYNDRNSALTSAIKNNSNYVRVEGLCFDKENNMWMTNSGAGGGIRVLKNDGKWSSLSYPDLNDQSLIDKILITSRGHKWINIPRDKPGVFVLDDKNTIDTVSDDVSNFYESFNNIADGKPIPANGYFCISEDKNGSIWMGTNNGLIICPVPMYAPEGGSKFYCTRIIRTDEEGIPGYFLDGEKVTAIAVDGGNRKWIGTDNSGVFLVNEDGSETIHHFTTNDSPLLSNSIKSIAIDPISGKVYFGTDQGTISYMGDATEGTESYSDVYAFPNPVRPEYNDQVTVTGLMENSNVKITDINGNIIYQAKSAGGQLTWNCRNRSGSRVSTGVYLVMAATPDSKESVVTKIMVIK